MKNLLAETLKVIHDFGRSPCEIVYIGSNRTGHRCTWDEFMQLADEPYDRGYGSAQVATDLILLFADGSWMERAEYDGAEWWEFKQTPKIPLAEPLPIHRVIGELSPNLAELNEGEES